MLVLMKKRMGKGFKCRGDLFAVAEKPGTTVHSLDLLERVTRAVSILAHVEVASGVEIRPFELAEGLQAYFAGTISLNRLYDEGRLSRSWQVRQP